MTTLDHPLVRASCFCPLCQQVKDTGPVTCWICYKSHGLRYGNPASEKRIDTVEASLAMGTTPAELKSFVEKGQWAKYRIGGAA